MKTNDEERRQFRVVARMCAKHGLLQHQCYATKGSRGGAAMGDLAKIGIERFGLTVIQCHQAMTAARGDLAEFQNADRRRKAGVRNIPTDSDALVALIKRKWALEDQRAAGEGQRAAEARRAA